MLPENKKVKNHHVVYRRAFTTSVCGSQRINGIGPTVQNVLVQIIAKGSFERESKRDVYKESNKGCVYISYQWEKEREDVSQGETVGLWTVC